MSSFTSSGIARPRARNAALSFETAGVTVVLCNATPYQLDALAAAAHAARDQLLDELDDRCDCNGGDLPLFDHDRLCPRRLLAEYRGVEA